MSVENGAWTDVSMGQLVPGALVGGKEAVSGEIVYVARGRLPGKNALLPGKTIPSHKCAYVPWGGLENPIDKYQVLVLGSPHNWVPTEGSNIPDRAFVAGETEKSEPLYIGRVEHDGNLTPGKVQRSQKLCYIPFGGKELKFSKYEILVLK